VHVRKSHLATVPSDFELGSKVACTWHMGACLTLGLAFAIEAA
jgi:hypothetical protein